MKKKYTIIILIILVLGFIGLIIYDNINYNNKLSNIKIKANELSKQIEELKAKETVLESEFNTSNSELEELKTNLANLQNELKAANDKLNSL